MATRWAEVKVCSVKWSLGIQILFAHPCHDRSKYQEKVNIAHWRCCWFKRGCPINFSDGESSAFLVELHQKHNSEPPFPFHKSELSFSFFLIARLHQHRRRPSSICASYHPVSCWSCFYHFPAMVNIQTTILSLKKNVPWNPFESVIFITMPITIVIIRSPRTGERFCSNLQSCLNPYSSGR